MVTGKWWQTKTWLLVFFCGLEDTSRENMRKSFWQKLSKD
jgi:hypothetical protein